MTGAKADSWSEILLGVALLFILLRAWSGWRQGVVRQALSIVAVIGAYLAAAFGGRYVVPILRPLGYPDQLLSVLGGAALGIVLFLSVTVLSAILFKKTSEQSVGLIRWAYGGLGALLGTGFALVLIWVAIVAIRVLGTIAQSESESPRSASKRGAAPGSNPSGVHRVAQGLVGMKHALETGRTGLVVEHLDPVPEKLYATVSKLGQMVSSEQGLERFQGYPGVRALMHNEKLQALQRDPSIARAALARDYLALIRNPHVIEAANDPEIGTLLHGFELEKALDYALSKPENRPAR